MQATISRTHTPQSHSHSPDHLADRHVSHMHSHSHSHITVSEPAQLESLLHHKQASKQTSKPPTDRETGTRCLMITFPFPLFFHPFIFSLPSLPFLLSPPLRFTNNGNPLRTVHMGPRGLQRRISASVAVPWRDEKMDRKGQR